MGRSNRHGKISRKIKSEYPTIFVDQDSDFASIKIAPGIEAASYTKNGFIFCEDKKGKVIEIQILNLSSLKKPKKNAA